MYAPRIWSCSLLHLLCRFPFLVIPVIGGLIFCALYFIPQDCSTKALISFSFDDGYLSTYTKALPILEKYGYSGTVFVITSAIGSGGYMNAQQLQDLQRRGWEIGSHSHAHTFLTELSDAQLTYELVASKSILESLGLKVFGFASPGGRYDERTLNEIARYYFYHRTSWPAGLNSIPLATKEKYRLLAVSIEASTTLEEAKSWVLRAKEERKWLIFLFHQLDESGEYNWPSWQFEELVKFVHQEGFKGVSVFSLLND